MAQTLEKIYSPKQIEAQAQQIWDSGKFFHARVPAAGGPDTQPYTIVIPRPTLPVLCIWAMR